MLWVIGGLKENVKGLIWETIDYFNSLKCQCRGAFVDKHIKEIIEVLTVVVIWISS